MPVDARADSGTPAPRAYDRVARATHWLIAGLAVIVVSLGWAIPEAPRETEPRDALLLLHRSVGLLILAVMLFRLAWRISHRPPPLPPSLALLERLAAHSDHLLLYVFFLMQPVSGYINAAAAGHSVSFFGLFAIPPVLPANGRLSQLAIAVHLAGQFAIYALVAAHVVAALMHWLVRRDGIFERMLPQRRTKKRYTAG